MDDDPLFGHNTEHATDFQWLPWVALVIWCIWCVRLGHHKALKLPEGRGVAMCWLGALVAGGVAAVVQHDAWKLMQYGLGWGIAGVLAWEAGKSMAEASQTKWAKEREWWSKTLADTEAKANCKDNPKG